MDISSIGEKAKSTCPQLQIHGSSADHRKASQRGTPRRGFSTVSGAAPEKGSSSDFDYPFQELFA